MEREIDFFDCVAKRDRRPRVDDAVRALDGKERERCSERKNQRTPHGAVKLRVSERKGCFFLSCSC